QPYTGVRVIQGALVSVAQNMRVYDAFYTQPGSVDCNPIDSDTNKDILDLYHGVRDIGLGVLSSTSTVKDPWNAVDTDEDTFAEIWNGVGVLNEAFITPVFKMRTMPTDTLQIVTEIPGQPVLSLELVKDFKIQRYLGDTRVGPAIRPDNQTILNLRLLGLLGSGARSKVALTLADGLVYDRVEISYLNGVSVLGDFAKIYDVSILP